MTDSIDTQNASSLAPAAVLDQGGIIAWSGDGKTFALTGSQIPGPPKISLYTYGQGTLAETGTISSEASALSLAFSPNGKTLAAGGDDGAVRFWDVDSRKLENSLTAEPGWIPGMAFSPDGRTFVFRDPEGMLQTWDLAGGEPVQTDSMVFGFPAGVPGGFVFGPEGRWLGLIRHSSEFPKGRLEFVSLDGRDAPSVEPDEESGVLLNLAFNSPLVKMATLGMDPGGTHGVVRLWAVQDNRLALDLEFEAPSSTDSVSFSPDGSLLATGSAEYGVQLWDGNTGQLLTTLEDWFEAPFEAVTFSPDGRWLARSGTFAGLVSIYEVGDLASDSIRSLSLQSPKLVVNDIFQLQDHLAVLGYFAGDQVRGILDKPTDAAVREYQTATGLPASGIVDADTAASLADAYAAAVGPIPGAIGPESGSQVPTAAPTVVRTILPTEQDVANIPSIWDWHSLSDGLDLEAPGSHEFSITLNPDDTFIWPLYWCAADEIILAENLQSISVDFQVDLADVPPGDILEFDREVPDWKCHYWATLLTDWDPGASTTLAVLHGFADDVDDGRKDYQAGDYVYVLQVFVGDRP